MLFTIAGLILTIIVLIFTVKTYLRVKVGEIRASIESIGEINLSHNLRVKPILEDVDFVHKKTIIMLNFYIGIGPIMDVLPPPGWILTKPGWGYDKKVQEIVGDIKEVKSVVITEEGIRIVLSSLNPKEINLVIMKILMKMVTK